VPAHVTKRMMSDATGGVEALRSARPLEGFGERDRRFVLWPRWTRGDDARLNRRAGRARRSRLAKPAVWQL